MPDLQPVTDDSNSDDNESMADLNKRSEFGDEEDTDDEGGGMAISAEEWNAYFASGNTNLALAVFSCLWESLIVFAKDWLHVWA